MNQNYKCADFFPTWYSSIDPAPTKELVKKRIDAINSLIKSDGPDLWLEAVKIANGDKDYNSELATLLVTKFREFDISFPIISNENILKVLSQISLCFLFESNSKYSQSISMAVINSNFFEQNEISEIPFCDYAVQKSKQMDNYETGIMSEIEDQLLQKESEMEHDYYWQDEEDEEDEENEEDEEDEEDEEEEEEKSLSADDSFRLIKMVNYLGKENKKIKEESNVLWWLFGEYSELANSYFYDLSIGKMVLIAAQELVGLTSNTGYLQSSKHIITKALIISNRGKSKFKEITIAETLQESSEEIKNALGATGNLGLLTPLLYSLNLSTQSEKSEIWKSLCDQKIGNGNIEKKYMPAQIAFQFYKEIIFLNELANLKNE